MASDRPAILMTGSSGFIGSAVAQRFVGDYAVIGMDVVEPRDPAQVDQFVKVDLTSDENVAAALRTVGERTGQRLASVIHLAAYYDFSGEPSDLYEQVTIRGTERLLRGVRSFQLEQFIFSSTMLVHAPSRPGEKINEEWPLEPKWDYPKSKMQTEQLIRAQRGEVPVVLMRIAGVYADRCRSIPIAEQIRRIYEQQLTSRVFPGDTSHGQAFVHLDDLVEALWLAVQRRRQLPPQTVLLIGEDQTMSYDELQKQISQLIHDETLETRPIPKALAKAGAWVEEKIPAGEEPFIKPWMIDMADDHYELDIRRARDLLGWQPKHSLRQTLPKMIEALKADPAAWYREHKMEPPSSV